ncbi:unnamed protein product [Adineta ricciae]|uniref:Glycosyl transferase CAP10 domain-containing protein n=1 Tax=Adineta ricciae TaxID=249248 RepID=A0A815WA97_ADIRI|nr:unnamed protein product [Adineta ricciae]
MKSKNPFRCYNDDEAIFLKNFYQLDCENPFLKNVSLRNLNTSTDVCELFNEPYDNNENFTLYSRIKMEFKNFPQNITHNDILEMEVACPGCHHIQIIDSQLFIVNRKTSVNFQLRSRNIKSMLKQVIDTFQSIKNLEMFIHVQDAVMLNSSDLNKKKHKVPVFGFAKTHKPPIWGLHPDGIVLIPCFTLWASLAPGIGRWRSVLENVPKIAEKIKWENRMNKLMWRGAQTGDRQWLTEIGQRKNDSKLDIEFMDWKSSPISPYYSENFKTIQQFCEYQYLLHQEGWSYSNRLKYLLLCGSPVIFAHFREWEEYWYHLLKHDHNILIWKDKGNEKSFHNLTRHLMLDAQRAKLIGTNGKKLVQQYLNEQAILCYFRNVLIEYEKLFTYKPQKHPDAISIDEFLVGHFT